jgi:hypothetical protein
LSLAILPEQLENSLAAELETPPDEVLAIFNNLYKISLYYKKLLVDLKYYSQQIFQTHIGIKLDFEI